MFFPEQKRLKQEATRTSNPAVEPPAGSEEIPIDAACLRCWFRLPVNKIIMGRKPVLASSTCGVSRPPPRPPCQAKLPSPIIVVRIVQ